MEKEFELSQVLAIGFEHAAAFDPAQLEFRPEVRDMCAADKCRHYNRSWSCPPACGTIEESVEKARKYSKGVMVQTTAFMEDSFDIETMFEAAEDHKERFGQLAAYMRTIDPDCLPMGAGGCNICSKCSYPDAPCRFPDRAFTSMEAYGLFVGAECKKAGLEYNYGQNSLTYTSCVLFN